MTDIENAALRFAIEAKDAQIKELEKKLEKAKAFIKAECYCEMDGEIPKHCKNCKFLEGDRMIDQFLESVKSVQELMDENTSLRVRLSDEYNKGFADAMVRKASCCERNEKKLEIARFYLNYIEYFTFGLAPVKAKSALKQIASVDV